MSRETSPLTKRFLEKDLTLEDRLLDKVEETKDGCIFWNGAFSDSGYPTIYACGKSMLAHRVSHVIYNDDIPKNRFVLHSCNNISCVNPDHLYLGTDSECKVKMYKVNPKAKDKFKSKVTISDLNEAVKLLLRGASLKEAGSEFGISASHLRHLLKEKNLVGDLRTRRINIWR